MFVMKFLSADWRSSDGRTDWLTMLEDVNHVFGSLSLLGSYGTTFIKQLSVNITVFVFLLSFLLKFISHCIIVGWHWDMMKFIIFTILSPVVLSLSNDSGDVGVPMYCDECLEITVTSSAGASIHQPQTLGRSVTEGWWTFMLTWRKPPKRGKW